MLKQYSPVRISILTEPQSRIKVLATKRRFLPQICQAAQFFLALKPRRGKAAGSPGVSPVTGRWETKSTSCHVLPQQLWASQLLLETIQPSPLKHLCGDKGGCIRKGQILDVLMALPTMIIIWGWLRLPPLLVFKKYHPEQIKKSTSQSHCSWIFPWLILWLTVMKHQFIFIT